jgi:hypothetical protein
MIARQNLSAKKKTVFCGNIKIEFQFKKFKPTLKKGSITSSNDVILFKVQRVSKKKKSIKYNFKSHI